MELRHLRYFIALADVLHFGRAAAALQIAQPSLSHQIRQLEQELQTNLLERTTKRVRLTDAGRAFLEEARQTLAQADRAALVARRASRGELGTLRIGFAHWVDPTRVLASIKSFNSRHPGIQIDLQTMNVPLQIAALRDGRLDVGFVRPPIPGCARRLGMNPKKLPGLRPSSQQRWKLPVGAFIEECYRKRFGGEAENADAHVPKPRSNSHPSLQGKRTRR